MTSNACKLVINFLDAKNVFEVCLIQKNEKNRFPGNLIVPEGFICIVVDITVAVLCQIMQSYHKIKLHVPGSLTILGNCLQIACIGPKFLSLSLLDSILKL